MIKSLPSASWWANKQRVPINCLGMGCNIQRRKQQMHHFRLRAWCFFFDHLYTTDMLPCGGLYATYHLLREPEATIDLMRKFPWVKIFAQQGLWKIMICSLKIPVIMHDKYIYIKHAVRKCGHCKTKLLHYCHAIIPALHFFNANIQLILHIYHHTWSTYTYASTWMIANPDNLRFRFVFSHTAPPALM